MTAINRFVAIVAAGSFIVSPALAQKIGGIPAAVTVNATDKIPVSQSGTTAAITPVQLATYLAPTFQAKDADLDAIAVLSTTGFGRSFLTMPDAPTTRANLGLGTLATQSGTFSGSSSGINTGDQVDVTGNAGTASRLLSARTITLSGDASGSLTFDGSSNAAAVVTLPTVNSTAGSFGGPLLIPILTTNAKGLVTASGQVPLGVVPVAQGGTGDTGSAWTTYNATITCYSGTLTSGTAVVRYHTLGKTIDYVVAVNITTNGSCGGQISMNLPVASFNGPAVYIGAGQELAKTGASLISRVYPNQQSVSIVTSTNGYAAGDGYSLHVSGKYEAN